MGVRRLAMIVYRSRATPPAVRERVQASRARRALLASVGQPPTTFSEKVRYRMAVDRRAILVTFVDKVAVRRYVAERVGDHVHRLNPSTNFDFLFSALGPRRKA